MRSFFVLLLFVAFNAPLFYGTSQASMTEHAERKLIDQHWADRAPSGQALQNVHDSIEIAIRLAKKTPDTVERIRLHNKAAASAQYVIRNVFGLPDVNPLSNVDDFFKKLINMRIFTEKLERGLSEKVLSSLQPSINLLAAKGDKLSREGRRALAEAYIYQDALADLPDYKRYVFAQKVIDLGEKDVLDYAPYRIMKMLLSQPDHSVLALVRQHAPEYSPTKKPHPNHPDKWSGESELEMADVFIKAAFDNTQHKNLGISRHGGNNLHYIDHLFIKGSTHKACRIAKTFVAQVPNDLHPNRVSETIREQKVGHQFIRRKCTHTDDDEHYDFPYYSGDRATPQNVHTGSRLNDLASHGLTLDKLLKFIITLPNGLESANAVMLDSTRKINFDNDADYFQGEARLTAGIRLAGVASGVFLITNFFSKSTQSLAPGMTRTVFRKIAPVLGTITLLVSGYYLLNTRSQHKQIYAFGDDRGQIERQVVISSPLEESRSCNIAFLLSDDMLRYRISHCLDKDTHGGVITMVTPLNTPAWPVLIVQPHSVPGSFRFNYKTKKFETNNDKP